MIGQETNYVCGPFNKPDDVKSELYFINPISHPTFMVRRDFVLSNNLFYNAKFLRNQDFELFTRMVKYGSIYIIKKVLLLYRVNYNLKDAINNINNENRYPIEIHKSQIKQLIENVDENALNNHLVLSQNKELNINNYKDVKEYCDNIIKINTEKKVYNQKSFNKIVSNRLFVALLKSSISKKDKINLVIENISFSNLYFVMFKVYFKIINMINPRVRVKDYE